MCGTFAPLKSWHAEASTQYNHILTRIHTRAALVTQSNTFPDARDPIVRPRCHTVLEAHTPPLYNCPFFLLRNFSQTPDYQFHLVLRCPCTKSCSKPSCVPQLVVNAPHYLVAYITVLFSCTRRRLYNCPFFLRFALALLSGFQARSHIHGRDQKSQKVFSISWKCDCPIHQCSVCCLPSWGIPGCVHSSRLHHLCCRSQSVWCCLLSL